MTKRCVDCVSEGITTRRKLAVGRNGNLVPGPRCTTHHRARRLHTRNMSWELRLLTVYGLAPAEYWAVYEFQSGKCYICQRATGAKRKLSVDHDHSTGMIRGLLCQPCNRDVLGHLRDDTEALKRAIDYLERPPRLRLDRMAGRPGEGDMTLYHRRVNVGGDHFVGVSTSAPAHEKTLVFLHGFVVNRRVYAPMLEILAESYDVIAIDLAGHGDTESLPAGHSFEDLVSLVIETLYELGVYSAVFVGHSLGGRVAAQIAADTNMVEELVLMSAAVGQPFDDYENQPTWVKLSVLPMRAAATFIDTLLDGPRNPLDASVYYAKMALAVMDSFPGFLRVGWAVTFGVDTIVPLSAIAYKQIPTHIIHGDKDLVVPIACADSAADVADAFIQVVEGAHHSWMISDPVRGAEEIMWVLG